MKKKTAIVLGLSAFSAGIATTLHTQKKLKDEENRRKLYDFGNNSVYKFLNGISSVLPDVDRTHVVDYDSKGFMAGHDVFLNKPKKSAKWSLGYADVSVLPDDVGFGEYYLGGYLSYPPNRASNAIDDQMFRCICIDDGSGRGSVVFGVLDSVGMSSTDIRNIRLKLKDFAEENNIVSINISVTHSHSCIDTQGLWGDLKTAFKHNVKAVKNGETDGFITGKNPQHMEMIFDKSADAIKRAFADMKQGNLYRATVDGLNYSRDKRPPNVIVKDITTLNFVPDDGSRPTRAIALAAHPTSFSNKNTSVSADYPYYLCEEIAESGANGIFFQGPQAAVATNRGAFAENAPTHLDSIREYGRGIARYCINLDDSDYEKVSPILNIRNTELALPANNPIMLSIMKLQLANNIVLRTGDHKNDLVVLTELGYAEIGEKLKLALVPGELMPEVLLGDAYTSDKAYNRTDWSMPAMKDLVDGYLLGLGLCNDSIGYIVPDNDYGSIFAPLHYEESVSVGNNTASIIVKEFEKLVKDSDMLKQ